MLVLVGVVLQGPIRDFLVHDRALAGTGYDCGKQADIDLAMDEQCDGLRRNALAAVPDEMREECGQAHAVVGTRLFREQHASARVGQCKVTGAVDLCVPGEPVCTLPINEGRWYSVMFWRAW